MGNGYKYATTNQQLQQQHNSSRNFLPLLCRLSLKDVLKFPKSSDSDRSSSSSSSSSSDEDPSSPKVSCIGQVRKRGNNKLTSTATVPKSADNFKYNKLRKLFSGKNLLTTATAATTFDSSHSGKIRTTKEQQVMIRNGMRSRRPPAMAQPSVNILELDPPLPVVMKKVHQDEVNLWKRRCGGGNGNGIRLTSLQIQQIHVPNNQLLPPITV